MAKKIKEQVDLNDIFYDGAHDDASKAKAMRSQLWPLAVAVYAYFKPLRLGPICNLDDDEELFHFLTESGLPVVCLKLASNGDVRVMTADRNFHGYEVDKVTPYSTVLSTNNIRYAVTKLKPNARHDSKVAITGAIQNAKVGISEFMFRALDGVVDDLAVERMNKPRVETPRHLTAALMGMVIDGKDKDSLNTSQWHELTTAYAKYTVENNKFEAAVTRAADMFNGDKWVAFNHILGGIVVGAVSSKPMLAAYNAYKATGSYPDFVAHNYIEPVVPFKWYKNIESMPQDIRSEFEVSAVMLRAHTNSTGILPNIAESNIEVWEPVEAFGVSSYLPNSADCIVFNK